MIDAVWIQRASGRVGRLISIALMALVLAGGICPPLYGEIVPHAHLFVGGAPPTNWRHHVHENPLVVFFGAPVGRSDADENVSVKSLTSPPATSVVNGRAVSIYAGSMLLVITAAELGPILSYLAAIEPPAGNGRILQSCSVYPRAICQAPRPPPPRAR